MHNKKLFLTLFISFLFLTNIHAVGAGILFSAQPEISFNQNGTASFCMASKLSGSVNFERLRTIPSIGIEIKIGDSLYYGFFGALDYKFFTTQLHNVWSFYSCIGFAADLCYDFWNSVNFGAGVRAVAGISLLLFDGYMELYAQEVINPTANVYTNKNGSPDFCIKLPFESGIRFYF